MCPATGIPASATPAETSGLVLFDLDNTLIDRVAAFRVWASAFVAGRGLGGEPEVRWLEEADRDGFAPRPAFFGQVRDRFGLNDAVEDLLDAYGEQYPWCVTPPPPETFSALERLRTAGWKVGVVTNGAPTQETKFSAAGLEDALDGWVISAVVGARKPDPVIFAAAAEVCGASLTGAWVVGDSPEVDIAGAANCGLRSIWIRRGRDWSTSEYRPDATVDSIPEAVAHIVADCEVPA